MLGAESSVVVTVHHYFIGAACTQFLPQTELLFIDLFTLQVDDVFYDVLFLFLLLLSLQTFPFPAAASPSYQLAEGEGNL